MSWFGCYFISRALTVVYTAAILLRKFRVVVMQMMNKLGFCKGLSVVVCICLGSDDDIYACVLV